MATGEVHIEKRTVFETAISMWTRLRRIKIQRWIVMSCKRLLSSLFAASLRRLIPTRHFSRRHEEMKENALQKGLPVPDEAAVRDRVLKKHVDTPDLATVKDFLRFHAAMSKGKIREEITCDGDLLGPRWRPRTSPSPSLPGPPSSSFYFWVRTLLSAYLIGFLVISCF
jgi:hypothetical protein